MTIKKELFINDFVTTDLVIDVEQVNYWKTFVMKNLKIGVELESEFKPTTNIPDASRNLITKLKPTKNNAKFGDLGVHSVIRDGSLSNGLELPMIGKRFDFWSNMHNTKIVVDAMIEEGAILHQRAGIHNHMLLSYNNSGSEMEKNMPGIILRNFMQLFRRFASELIWLTSTNKGSNGKITRMANFREITRLMNMTPANLNRTTEEYMDSLSGSYPFIRTRNMLKVNGEEISTFHVELRFPDASLNPTQIVSQQVLFKAMLLKAIEFSQYGIVNASGTTELWEEQKTLTNAILAPSNMRLSKELTSDQEDIVRQRAENMVLYFTNNIKQVEPLALEVLEKLASKPISKRRQENDDIDVIEKQLQVKDNRTKKQFEAIAKVIDLMDIIGHDTKKSWELALSEQLGISHKMANHHVWKLSQERPLEFDKKLGTVIFV